MIPHLKTANSQLKIKCNCPHIHSNYFEVQLQKTHTLRQVNYRLHH